MFSFCYMLFFINHDLWLDELTSIKRFMLVPILETVTSYPIPNNHVGFNLFGNFYTRILFIRDFDCLLESPFLIRLYPFIFSCGTIYYTYKIAWRFFNPKMSLIVLVCLMTTIPFQNFFLAVRGYSPSIFFFAAILFYTFRYWEEKRKKDWVLLVFLAAIACYFLPVNYYYLAGLVGYMLLAGSLFFLFPKIANLLGNYDRYLKASFAISLGVGLSLLAYFPIFQEVFFNEYVEGAKPFQFNNIKRFPTIVYHFTSGRYLLLIIALIGYWKWLRDDLQKSLDPRLERIIMLVAVFVAPFMISIIRGDASPNRIFSILAPIFSLLLAFGLFIFLEKLLEPQKRNWLLLGITLYSIFMFGLESRKIKNHLHQDIVSGSRSANLYYNFHLWHYQPNKVFSFYKNNHYNSGIPFVLGHQGPDGTHFYLDHYKIDYLPSDSLNSLIRDGKSFDLETRYPAIFSDSMHTKHPEYSVKSLTEGLSDHNVFQCRKIK